MLEQFIACAKENGWRIKLSQQNAYTLPDEVSGRYSVPNEYKLFLSQVEACVNPTETKWFLCADDYTPKPESSFRWNEFEIISLDAAGNDSQWAAAVKAFGISIFHSSCWWAERMSITLLT